MGQIVATPAECSTKQGDDDESEDDLTSIGYDFELSR